MPRPRVALVGVGWFGRHHLRVLKALHRERRLDFAGVVARNTRRARGIASQFGVRGYPSLEAALADEIDVVDIATPASTHAALVRRALPHAHVFVEKPLAPTVAECERLYRLARRHSRLLAVGHILRFNDAVSRVKRILARHGPPHLIRIEMVGGSTPPPDDAGAVLTFVHVFDVLDELIGMPPRQSIPIARVGGARGGERHAVVALTYPHGVSAIVEVGWLGGVKRRRLEVQFRDFVVETDLLGQTVGVVRPTGRSRLRCYRREPLRVELEHFLAALGGRHEVRPPPQAVLRVMRMARDAQAALRRGRPVRWRS